MNKPMFIFYNANVETDFQSILATCFDGKSMIGEKVTNSDLLVIGQSLSTIDYAFPFCYLDDNLVLKQVQIKQAHAWESPTSPPYPKIKVTQDNNFDIWGIVIATIKYNRRSRK